MLSNNESLDGNDWGEWVREGNNLLRIVQRSLIVFNWNMRELSAVLETPENRTEVALALQAGTSPSADNYWHLVDQRLHNALAGATSLIDHTRKLTDFHIRLSPEFVQDWNNKIDPIKNSPRSNFLRRFRNYLLHYGVAPLSLNMQLGDLSTVIELNRDRLLEWKDWTSPARTFLLEQPETIPLAKVINGYTTEMLAAYEWLNNEAATLREDTKTLDRLPRYKADGA